MRPIKEPPGLVNNLLEDLARYKKKHGPMSKSEMMSALKMLHQKRKKYLGKDTEWWEGQPNPGLKQLLDIDPGRLKTFYTDGTLDEGLMENYEDPYPAVLSSGYLGAGIYYPENIGKGEIPIFEPDPKSKTGQRLVGKYIRDEKKQRRAVRFDDNVIEEINKVNRIKGE